VAAQVHLCRLSDDLLAFAKLGSGTLALDCGPVSVRDICRATEQLTEPQLAERALHFSSRCADGALFVLADASKVQQILLNLVANAMKFTAGGGTISLEATADAAFVSVAVRDTGVGIPADKLAAIFEPFVQLEKYPQSRSGVGLGLSISRELARAMHGDLTVTSEVGEGSTFTLLLPRLAD
jgi:signal transduction histidine kinase